MMSNPKDVLEIIVKQPSLNTWWFRLPLIVGSYIFAADVLPNLLFVVINSVGYLPYSDRPGPGWQMPHFPSGEELRFFIGFADLILKATAIYGSIFAVCGLILGFCGLRRWALRVLAAPTAFLASGIIMAAGGWLIAISPFGVYIAAACGAVWGLFVFPRLVPSAAIRVPTAARIALPVAMWIAGTYLLMKPFLPDRGLTNGKIEVIRRDDTGAELPKIDLSFIGASISRELNGSRKYVSTDRVEFSTDVRNQVRVLLMIDDERAIGHTFVLPRSGNAIYRQHEGVWSEQEIGAKASKITLELISTDGRNISLRIKGRCCSSFAETHEAY